MIALDSGSGSGSDALSGSGSGGTVSGQVWLDNNGDGSLDDGELGYSGATVYLDNSSGQMLQSTTTDSNGNYQFTVNSGWCPIFVERLGSSAIQR